ncbi:MAG: spherulation-specific family 4 protein [Myxococcales bacterium]|nr:spherulation-specific family 4 protein [Myxococcales bacterium]
MRLTLASRPLASILAALLALGAGGCPGSDDEGSSDGGSTGANTSTTGDTRTSAPSTSDGLGSSGMADTSTGGADTSTGGADTSTGGADTSTGADSSTGAVLEAGGTIIPLYTYPTDPSWTTVATAKLEHPEVEVVAIINPGSGPGMVLDPSYDAGITALQAAGVVVIGYVYTSYAGRPAADVQADITSYASFYPQLEGIMFDEMSNVPGNEAYYAGLSTFAAGLGFGFTVGNPGAGIPESFVDTVDTMFVYEAAGLPMPEALGGWTDAYDRSHFAIIPHSVPSLDAGFVSAALQHVGWIYVTDDVLPNPWDSLPSYFGDLMDQLAAG